MIGPNANSRAALIGNYHGTSSEYITVLEGIQRYVGDEIRVLYSEGSQLKVDKTENLAMENDRLSEAKIVAENSDVVLLVVGLDEFLEGEEGDEGNHYASGDKEDLQLPATQRRLMEAVVDTGKPTILCLMAGSDIDLSYAREHFNAILQLWYPGARGGKVAAEVLFGETSPSGKLCITFYEGTEGLPDFEDYSMEGRTYRYIKNKAQYPFGYGLTYGKVMVKNAVLTEMESTEAVKYEIVAAVKNEGKTDTQDVVQVYVKDMDSSFAPLHPRLCGFKRVTVKAGEEQEIRITLDKHAFTVIEESGKRIKDGSHFALFVGCSQPDERSVELTGIRPVCVEVNI